MLIQKYGTDSADDVTAMAAAWTLRREILQMGHDGIVAIGARLNEGRLTIVELNRDVPGTVQTNAGYHEERKTAHIYRIGQRVKPRELSVIQPETVSIHH